MSETDVSQLAELALSQFGDAWRCDNVSYLWIHNNWSATKDKPRPKNWGNQIRNLEKAVWDALTLLSPPADPSARGSKSRSPPRPRSPPRSLGSSLGSSSSAPDQDKAAIVARLMANSDAELPEKFDWTAASHVPLEVFCRAGRPTYPAYDAVVAMLPIVIRAPTLALRLQRRNLRWSPGSPRRWSLWDGQSCISSRCCRR